MKSNDSKNIVNCVSTMIDENDNIVVLFRRKLLFENLEGHDNFHGL